MMSIISRREKSREEEPSLYKLHAEDLSLHISIEGLVSIVGEELLLLISHADRDE